MLELQHVHRLQSSASICPCSHQLLPSFMWLRRNKAAGFYPFSALQELVEASSKASSYARSFIRDLATTGVAFALEAVVVPCWRGGVDFWLFEHNLIIQVDGEQHFFLDMHGTPAKEQQALDRKFDALCWALGLRVVRVHFKDANRALLLLAKALRLVRRHPRVRFVLYSQFYKFKVPTVSDMVELWPGQLPVVYLRLGAMAMQACWRWQSADGRCDPE